MIEIVLLLKYKIPYPAQIQGIPKTNSLFMLHLWLLCGMFMYLRWEMSLSNSCNLKPT